MRKSIFLYFCFFFIFFTCYTFAGTALMSTYYPAPKAAYNTVELYTGYTASTDQSCQYNNIYPQSPNHGNNEPDFGCCGSTNRGAIFQTSVGSCGTMWCQGNFVYGPTADEPPAQLYECYGSGWPNSANQWCNTTANTGSGNAFNPNDLGMILTDPQGTLHACMYNYYYHYGVYGGALRPTFYTDTSFPQQCYNVFCSFTTPASPWVSPQQNGWGNFSPQTAACADVQCAPGYETVWLPNANTHDPGYDLFKTSSNSYTESWVCCPQSLIQYTPLTGGCGYIGTLGNSNPTSYYGEVVCGGGWTVPPDYPAHDIKCTPDSTDYTYTWTNNPSGWYDTGQPCPPEPTIMPTDQRW
jgi:hypothetical protein